jgi:bifunctional enzyme CysN/CysC
MNRKDSLFSMTDAAMTAGNLGEFNFTLSKNERAALKNQKGQVIWLTGLSGSGKSTVANALEQRLAKNGIHTYILDGDTLRKGLSAGLSFTPEDRAENVRRVAEVARLMVDAGLVVIVALVSPFAADRDLARGRFEPGEFSEVWVRTPADVCAARDPKGLYKKAASGEIKNMTGIGQEYEAPKHAELVLDGTAQIEANVDILIAKNFGYLAWRDRPLEETLEYML